MNLHEGGADEAPKEVPNHAGWATFEARVRGRRFARCLERANQMIDLGRLDEARDALNEARILSPDAPELAELERRIASQPAPGAILLAATAQPFESESDPGWPRVLAGIAAVVVLFALVGYGLMQIQYSSSPAITLTTAQLSQAPSPLAPPDAPQTETEQKIASDPVQANAAPAANAVTSPALQMPPSSPPQDSAAVPLPETRATLPQRADNSVRRAVRNVEQAVAQPPTPWARLSIPPTAGVDGTPASHHPPGATSTGVTPALGENQPVEAVALAMTSTSPTPVATSGETHAAPPLDVPVPASHTPAIDLRHEESLRIRSVLLRYESAYNRLDAKAASSIWPNVNESALNRAFSGLLSQKVSLGLCDITVIGDIGGASCAGKARWEPRIGGGLQTADRYWNFHLRKGADGWKIQEISVR